MKYTFLKPKFFFMMLIISIQTIAQQSGKKLFTLLPSSFTGINFRNDIVEDVNMFYYKYESLYLGAGVSVGDINNDGLQDLYFASTLQTNRLYLNLGDFRFKDITELAGVNAAGGIKTGVNMVDINNDGYLDIFVSRSGPGDPESRRNLFYINNGNLTFTERAAELGLNDPSFTIQTYFFDFDRDGDKDVFSINQPDDFSTAMLIPTKMVNGKLVYAGDTARTYVSNRLYRNNNGKFADVTKNAGLLSHAFALSASFFDFNNDGWMDIYVANDFNKPDCIYINNHNGTFSNKLSDYIQHVCLSSMGSDINDINNDGLEDISVTDMAIEDPVRQKQLFVQNLNYDKFELLLRFDLYYQYPRNMLQLNNGNGTFSEIGYFSGTAQTDWSWANLIADYDNDGWKDLFIANGLKRDITDWDYKVFVLDSIKNLMAKGISVNLADWFKLIPSVKVKNYFYRNNGSLIFDNYSDSWCDQPPSFSNSAAYADLDNDGDLDLITNNIDDPPFVYRNNSRELDRSGFLRFRLLRNRNSGEEVYGVVVKIYDKKGDLQLQRYDPQRGYMGTMEHFLHFGTRNDPIIPKIEISFPAGGKIILSDVAVNQVMTIYESDATINNTPDVKKAAVFKATAPAAFNYFHRENDFIDFKREPLIPYKCSRKGPYYAIADVNADNREDIFVGGAAGFEGKLLIQSPQGNFTEKKQAVFAADKNFEDAGVLFFDADGDKDNDLYVVSGGAEFDAGSTRYQDRLYINDGKGNFIRSLTALPREVYNGSYVIPLDFDEDGDEDLFVGGGVFPGKFPQHDRNILLQNTRGVFKNVTDIIATELNQTGITNYAAWGDVDGDKKNELLVAGEWMPIMIFSMKDGKFEKRNTPLKIKQEGLGEISATMQDLSGWWNVIKLNDIDHDGDMDILAGNRGLNSKITATINEPCTIYGKDFDNNGSYDAVLGYYIWGKCYPMYHRDQLIDQMPSMRKKFTRYSQYAGTTLDEVFTNEQKKDMQVFKTAVFESGVFLNDGNNSFRFEAFPDKSQFSNINDMLVDDFDKDGIIDILVCGNSYDPDVSTGNYDATAALLLKGTGNGKFIPIPQFTSGLNIKGEVRKMIYPEHHLPGAQANRRVIFLKNGAASQIFSTQ